MKTNTIDNSTIVLNHNKYLLKLKNFLSNKLEGKFFTYSYSCLLLPAYMFTFHKMIIEAILLTFMVGLIFGINIQLGIFSFFLIPLFFFNIYEMKSQRVYNNSVLLADKFNSGNTVKSFKSLMRLYLNIKYKVDVQERISALDLYLMRMQPRGFFLGSFYSFVFFFCSPLIFLIGASTFNSDYQKVLTLTSQDLNNYRYNYTQYFNQTINSDNQDIAKNSAIELSKMHKLSQNLYMLRFINDNEDMQPEIKNTTK